MTGLTIKLTQDRLTGEKEILILAHRGLIVMGPKKCTKQLAFTFLDKINLRGIDRRKKFRFGC